MPFTPPNGVAFHNAEEIPIEELCALLRQVVVFMQNLSLSSPSLRLFHDWWEHDGLHFEERPISFHELFEMVGTPRAVFDATPDEHAVFVGIAPEDSRWYLRFRAEWDADEKHIAGRFALILPSESTGAFRNEVVASAKELLVEESSESYYKRTIV